MGSVTGLTAARMLAIEAASVVSGTVTAGNLILTKHDGTTISAGNVLGPTGPTGATGQVTTTAMNTAILAAMPIGVIVDYIEATAPSGWLAMTGQTIASGSTTYPALWAKLPASMKSGTSIVFPDTASKVVFGYSATDANFNAIGKIGGANTHSLTIAELPAAGITIDPPATTATVDIAAFNATVDIAAFTAAVNPPSTTSSGQSATHTHQYYHPGGGAQVQIGTQATATMDTGYTWNSGANSNDHTHTIDIPSFNITIDPPATTVSIDPPITNVTVDIGSFTTGNIGSGTAISMTPAYITFLKIIKVA